MSSFKEGFTDFDTSWGRFFAILLRTLLIGAFIALLVFMVIVGARYAMQLPL